LKKWAFAFAAAAIVVIGCGGGSGGGNSTNTNGGNNGGTTSGDSTAFVSMASTPGLINFTFLTGAGRAVGSPTAIINRVVISDSFGEIETLLNPERALQLDAYT